MEDEGGLADHLSGISATDGRWHHIAVTWRSSDGQTRLYDNGVEASAPLFAACAAVRSVGVAPTRCGEGTELANLPSQTWRIRALAALPVPVASWHAGQPCRSWLLQGTEETLSCFMCPVCRCGA